jgi:hypothetical protein
MVILNYGKSCVLETSQLQKLQHLYLYNFIVRVWVIALTQVPIESQLLLEISGF